VERLVDRPAHAPYTAAPYEAVDSTVMARVVPRRRPAPPKSRTAGTQSDYRESEAQTAPYAPEAFLPLRPSVKQSALRATHHVPGRDNEPEVLTLRDPNYDAGGALGAADVDRIERARAKRAFEASLPPLSDVASLPLRRKLMEEWEEAEWCEREREIARLQEERLEVLKKAIDAREAEAESVAEKRLARMRFGALVEKRRKFEAVQTKRVRGLRKLELRRAELREQSAMAAEGPVSASAGRTVAEYASYASGTYAPTTREGRADVFGGVSNSTNHTTDPSRFAFDDDKRRSALDDFFELEASVPAYALDAERTVRAAERANLRMTGRLGASVALNPDATARRDSAPRSDSEQEEDSPEDEDGRGDHVGHFTEMTPPHQRDFGGEPRSDSDEGFPEDQKLAAPLRPEERREAAYFEQLDRTAAALARSKAGAGGERGAGAIWPAPLRDEGAEEKTLDERLAREAARATKMDDGPQRVERPETPELEPPLDEMAPEYRAVVLLQRLLRGRAAQNEINAGMERRAELIAELRADERSSGEDEDEEEDEDKDEDSVSDARALRLEAGPDVVSEADALFDSDDSDAESDGTWDSDADAELAASVARATARALAVLAIPDAEARADAFASTEAAAARAAAELARRRGAATAIQAAHRGRSERRRLGLERLDRLEREREEAARALAEAESRREKGGLVSSDVDEDAEAVSPRKNKNHPHVDVDALSSPDVASLTRVQLAAKEWVEREVRLDFLLAEAEAAAAEIPADVAADPRVAQLQRSAREHVRATAETRALASLGAGAGDARLASAALVESPSVAALQRAARARLSESGAFVSEPETDAEVNEDLASSPSARAMQSAARRYLRDALGASEAMRLDDLPQEDAEKVRRLQASARKLVLTSENENAENAPRSLAAAFGASEAFDASRYDHARVSRIQAAARGAAARREAARRRDAARAEAAAAAARVEAASSSAAASNRPSSSSNLSSSSSNRKSVVVEVEPDFADAAEAFLGTPREQEAALVIQSAHRRAEARKKARELRRLNEDPEYRATMEAAELERAAIAAQAARRGSVARRSVAEMRMQLEAEARGARAEEDDVEGEV
jgi:hypothetical protein